jgi:hypothetical protein
MHLKQMTSIYKFSTLVFLFGFSTNALSQDKLILEQRGKPEKTKELEFDREYHFHLLDTTYYYRKILGISSDTIMVTTWVMNPRKIEGDTLPYMVQDTLRISKSDIEIIRKDWFKSRKWLEPFGYVLIGAAMGVILLPVAAIDEGSDGVQQWLLFEAVLLGISLPPLFIGTRRTKYDLNKKWRIRE